MAQPLEFEVVLYPDPVLRKVSEPVRAFDEDLQAVVAAMFARMRKSKGVGLAAPQVGLRQRVLVLGPTGEEADDLVLINPVVVARAGDRTVFDEGCLSFPGIFAEVTRPDRCTVQSADLSGRPVEMEYSGFTSRVIQHEYDHLEGILLVDRMTPAEKLKHKSALDELVTRYKRARPPDGPRRETAHQR
jgi:peptide deformylase